MADYSITAVDRRVVFSGSAGTGPYAFTFPILAQTDIAVFKDSTKLTLTADYTVTINASTGTGSVTLASAASASNTITITGARSIERTTDFVTAGDLLASSLNTELDSQTIFVQQVSEDASRAIKAPVTDPTSINMTLPAKADRLSKVLDFNSTTGDPQAVNEIGTNRGSWSAGVQYKTRDLVKDTTTNNIFQANADHTSSGSLPITSNSDSGKWILLVNAEASTTSQSAAAASATAAAASAASASTAKTAAETAQAASETAKTASETAKTASETAQASASSSSSSASTSAATSTAQATISTTKAGEAAASATSAASSSASSTTAKTASEAAQAAAETAQAAAASSSSSASTSATNAAASANAAEAAAAAIFFEFETSTTMGNPSAGGVRFNNASVGSVTQICFSATSASSGNPDISDFIVTWDDSTSPVKGHLIIRESGAPGSSIVFSVTGTITDNTTHLIVPVSHVSSAGVSLSASDDLFFSFSRTGNVGAAGAGSGDLLASNNLSDLQNAGTSRTNLGVAIGSDVQAHDADLDALAALAKTDGNIIVGNGSTWVAESGATARTSLGVDAAGTDNSTAVTLAGSLDYITISGQEITRNEITTADLADDAITAAKIADDAVGLAALAPGTDGVIISYDASGNPVHIGPGSDGQVLTSTGAGSPPAFEDAGGGGGAWAVTSSGEFSSTSALEVAVGKTTKIFMTDVLMSAGTSQTIRIQYSTNNGASYDTGNNWMIIQTPNSTGAAGFNGGSVATAVQVAHGSMIPSFFSGTNMAEITLYEPAATTFKFVHYYQCNASSTINQFFNCYVWKNATAANKVKIFPSSGTFTSGGFVVCELN